MDDFEIQWASVCRDVEEQFRQAEETAAAQLEGFQTAMLQEKIQAAIDAAADEQQSRQPW
jgi:hypothetical protein